MVLLHGLKMIQSLILKRTYNLNKMKNLPYNSKSTQIDEEFSKMVQKELELGHMAGGTIERMFESMKESKTPTGEEKPYKIVFLIDDSEVLWDENKIFVEYRREDNLGPIDNSIDKIEIKDFCRWMKKEKHNVITHEGHNPNGVFDQWAREYEPEDLLRDGLFELNYHLELFLSDRGY